MYLTIVWVRNKQPLTSKEVRRVGPPSQSLPPLNAPHGQSRRMLTKVSLVCFVFKFIGLY